MACSTVVLALPRATASIAYLHVYALISISFRKRRSERFVDDVISSSMASLSSPDLCVLAMREMRKIFKALALLTSPAAVFKALSGIDDVGGVSGRLELGGERCRRKVEGTVQHPSPPASATHRAQ